MIYPKNMTILGQVVPVEIIKTPLYQVYTCPHCVNPNTGRAFEFHAPYGEGKACPACGREDTQPKEHTYVLGQYSVRDNKIKNFHSELESMRQVCETSFVHETIEAINSICDLKLSHQTITTLAASLYQAFSTGKVDFSKNGDIEYASAA